MSLVNPYDMPGMGSATLSSERTITWGTINQQEFVTVVLDSATVDSTNTPTTKLRAGLVLGKITASGKYTQYDPTATNGSEVPLLILANDVNMLNLTTGSAEDKQGFCLVKGFVKGDQLLGLDLAARRAMSKQFLFDDDFIGNTFMRKTVAKTANYTVLAADNNTLFTNAGASGAVTFTLPTVGRGYHFWFYVEADQSVTVAGATGTVVAFNDAAANSVAFSTTAEKVGGCIEVFSNAAGTKWLTVIHVAQAAGTPQTVTIAT